MSRSLKITTIENGKTVEVRYVLDAHEFIIGRMGYRLPSGGEGWTVTEPWDGGFAKLEQPEAEPAAYPTQAYTPQGPFDHKAACRRIEWLENQREDLRKANDAMAAHISELQAKLDQKVSPKLFPPEAEERTHIHMQEVRTALVKMEEIAASVEDRAMWIDKRDKAWTESVANFTATNGARIDRLSEIAREHDRRWYDLTNLVEALTGALRKT